MDKKPSSPNRKPFLIIPTLLAAVVVAILLAGGGFAFAASQESHDVFCSSCHTQPESTFFQREAAGSPVDLASFHSSGQYARCIDCHSGQGLFGRLQAELLGARNAFKWYTGSAVQPAVLTFPIANANCLKCHQNVTQRGFTPKEQITVPGLNGGGGGESEGGRNNHWHENLARWQAATPATAGSCVSCHSGHPTSGTTQTGFMDSQAVQNTCNACHQVLRREGGGG